MSVNHFDDIMRTISIDDKEKKDERNGPPPAFVPVLTVMVDYGNAPFLWLVERPDQGGVGGMLCESGGWEDYYPMSEAL